MDETKPLLYNVMYVGKDGNRKRYGIYCHAFDRWLLIDQHDLWATLETAKLLSSKIASTVFVLPNESTDINNDNCLDYSIFDKSKYIKGNHPELIKGQTPITTIISDPSQIFFQGVPEDFKEGDALNKLIELKEYANFVFHSVCAANFVSSTNMHDNASFAQTVFPEEWTNLVDSQYDRSQMKDGIIAELKRILYLSMSVDEAKNKISELWITSQATAFSDGYYKLIGPA